MGVRDGEKAVLVNPSEIMAIMRRILKGKLITIVEICKQIARNHKVKGCCSLTTGIFIMAIANAVEEAAREGEKRALVQMLLRSESTPLLLGSGAAAENHHSNMVPTTWPRLQISDNTIIALDTISTLSYS